MNADIVIIGAGIAGLRCGIELLRKRPSLTVVLLEKYNYTGGRVVTYHKKLDSIPGRCGKLQWENGAGRIHSDHTLVLQLLKEYSLTPIPIGDTMMYEEDGILTNNIFTETMKLLSEAFKKLSPEFLASHTLREVLELVLGEEKTKSLLLQFPYRGEVDTLRADLAIHSFQEEMGTYKGYFVVKEGLSALIHGMAKEFEKLGGTILSSQDVQAIEKSGSVCLVKTKTPSGDALWETPTVICALHSDALSKIPLFSDWKPLSYVQMEPLVRTYAVFPTSKGTSWFSDLPKVTSAGPLRFFIPMDPSCGTVMISYTDGDDARDILEILDTKGEEALGKFLVNEARKAFPDKKIPDPLFFKAHPWRSGCTYWTPGTYDPYQESKKALKPFSDMNLYICGESFSVRQAWMEGALEHADLLLKTHF